MRTSDLAGTYSALGWYRSGISSDPVVDFLIDQPNAWMSVDSSVGVVDLSDSTSGANIVGVGSAQPVDLDFSPETVAGYADDLAVDVPTGDSLVVSHDDLIVPPGGAGNEAEPECIDGDTGTTQIYNDLVPVSFGGTDHLLAAGFGVSNSIPITYTGNGGSGAYPPFLAIPAAVAPAENLPETGNGPIPLGPVAEINASSASTATSNTNNTVMASTTTGVAGAGLVINIVYDFSVNNAPNGFKVAIAAAVQYLESQFAAPITITIDVGYGEVAGQGLVSGALGESTTSLASFSYAQIKNALSAYATSSGDLSVSANLPANDPTNGGIFEISTAEAKALGLLASSTLDGSVGFSSSLPFDYSLNSVASGSYYFLGVVEHEITEVMGRISMLNSNAFSVLDLFRYSAPGTESFVGAQSAYFSLDGGKSNLDSFNTNPGGDFGDWAASAGNDAFVAFTHAGVVNAFSAADIAVMNTLGYAASSAPASTVPSVTAILDQPNTGVLNAGKTGTITIDFNEVVMVAGGVPRLTLNDGGTATYVSGSGSNALNFQYTVSSHDKNVASLTALTTNLNGATIQDGSGNSANLSLGGLTQSGPGIDTTIPAITAVIEQPPTGEINTGRKIIITLDFTETVTVSGGVPILMLNDAGAATYTSGSGSSTLDFNYTVGPNDSDVGSLLVNSVNLNGSTIQDGGGNIANLSLVGINETGPQIDTAVPLIKITSPGGLTSQPIQMVSGTADLSDIGTSVVILDGTAQVGSAKVQSDGLWASSLVLHGDGVHLITAQDTDAAGNVGTSSSITYTLNSITASGGILEPLSAAQEIAAIYVGYFNRAPDNSGFSFWEGQFSQALNVGQSTDQALTNVSNAFEPQPETLALYPFLASGPLNPNSPNDVTGVENLCRKHLQQPL